MLVKKKREALNFYTDYEMELTPDGIPEAAKFLAYAPFYVIDNFITEPMLGELIDYTSKCDEKLHKGSVIGYTSTLSQEYNIRDSSIHFIEDEQFDRFNNYISDKVVEINKNVYDLDISCYMAPQYAVYGDKQHFNWHSDGPFGVMDRRGMNCIPNNLMWRKLSLSIALNDESEYGGGDFQILNMSANPSCSAINTIRLGKGSAIIFPAFCSHRVSPITLGVRKTLIYWFCGPRWK